MRNGKLRLMATALPARSPSFPDVPTLGEVGITGVSIVPWGGMFGPAALPREVVAQVSQALAQTLSREDVRDQLGKLAIDVAASTPEEMGALLRQQFDVWRQAVQAYGIRAE